MTSRMELPEAGVPTPMNAPVGFALLVPEDGLVPVLAGVVDVPGVASAPGVAVVLAAPAGVFPFAAPAAGVVGAAPNVDAAPKIFEGEMPKLVAAAGAAPPPDAELLPAADAVGDPGIPGDSEPASAPRPEVGNPVRGSPRNPRGVVRFLPTSIVRQSVDPVRGSAQRRRRNRMLLDFSSCSIEPG